MKNTQTEQVAEGPKLTHRLSWIVIGDGVQKIIFQIAEALGCMAMMPIHVSKLMCDKEHALVHVDLDISHGDTRYTFGMATSSLCKALTENGFGHFQLAGSVTDVETANKMLAKNMMTLPDIKQEGRLSLASAGAAWYDKFQEALAQCPPDGDCEKCVHKCKDGDQPPAAPAA